MCPSAGTLRGRGRCRVDGGDLARAGVSLPPTPDSVSNISGPDNVVRIGESTGVFSALA
jgi:hypothetical protein